MTDHLFRNGYVSMPVFAAHGFAGLEWFNELALDLEAGRLHPEQAKEKMRQRGIWTSEVRSALDVPTNVRQADLLDPLAVCHRPLARDTR